MLGLSAQSRRLEVAIYFSPIETIETTSWPQVGSIVFGRVGVNFFRNTGNNPEENSLVGLIWFGFRHIVACMMHRESLKGKHLICFSCIRVVEEIICCWPSLA